jgi:hypothetical protein
MAYVDWLIRGPKVGACNCDYGCPCEFNARPTYGECEGMEAMRIDEGYFGDVRLDGLIVAARYRWPGPVHEGGGVAQGIIDARADDAQIEALFKILGGEEQEPTTVFNIYGSTIEREIDPIFAPIEFECDMEGRCARFRVDGVMQAELSPIRNPVTGEEHHARIELPKGFEFRKAEVANADLQTHGEDLAFSHAGRYGAIWHAAYGPYGIVE